MALTVVTLALASCSASTQDSVVEKDRHLLRGDCRAQAIALTDVQASFVSLGERSFIKLRGQFYDPAALKAVPIYEVFDPSVENHTGIVVSGFADPNHRCPTLGHYPALFLTAIRRVD